jgi:hypothetical protein
MSDNRFLLVSNNPEQFRPDFYNWLVDNTHIYEEFEKRSLRVAQYRKHYSARTILEVMRHDSAIRELKGDWKINGNYTPCLARLFSLKNTEHKDLFEFRAIKVKGNG